MDNNKISKMAMLLSFSVVLSLIESFIPLFSSVPGIKLGLANIVIIFVIYKYSLKDALYISILRVILIGILRTGLFSISFFFSLVGALFSIFTMYILKSSKLSIVGVSIGGSISHSIGQILVAIIFLNNINIIYYLPILLISSIITGFIIGILGMKLINYYEYL